MTDRKKSTMDALFKHAENELKQYKPKKKYKAPEKAMVKEILIWARERGFNLDVIEASTYNTNYKFTVKAGYSDLSGNSPEGFATYIEVKAKDRRCTLGPKQYMFLSTKIKSGAFAVVCDSIERLAENYRVWLNYKRTGQDNMAKRYLMSELFVPTQFR